jgi:hypothetical protein
MPSWMEFHDSELLAATRAEGEVAILLDAYVHCWDDDGHQRRGTGWMQQIRVIVETGVGTVPEIAVPTPIVDGKLAIAHVAHSNLVPMPISSEEGVSLWIQLGTGETLEISGQSIHLECVGEPRYVEDLAGDLWPGTA